MREAFTAIAEAEPDVRIIKDLKGTVKLDAISNRIIHYRDIGKLDGTPVIYPYIVYDTVDGVDHAMLVVPFEEYGYLYARGFYYCLSEAGSEFYDVRNEILEISEREASTIVDNWNRLKTNKAGVIQRRLDKKLFLNFEELRSMAMKAGQALKEEAAQVLPELEERTWHIRSYVVRWFLLKKMLYVQYMVNKNIRTTVHDGDIHRQRNQARLIAEDVPFMSYREMWVVGTEDETPAPAQAENPFSQAEPYEPAEQSETEGTEVTE